MYMVLEAEKAAQKTPRRLNSGRTRRTATRETKNVKNTVKSPKPTWKAKAVSLPLSKVFKVSLRIKAGRVILTTKTGKIFFIVSVIRPERARL
jgi:hypothetical protein